MPRFGTVPVEVPVNRSLDDLAPAFRTAIQAVLSELGVQHWPFETRRTIDRQAYLYGFGRQYDDGRGVVTHADSVWTSWHGYGLAIDIVQKDNTPWDAPVTFWNQLGLCGERHGLAWGGRWRTPDLPHLQWGKCPPSPSLTDQQLAKTSGVASVWAKYKAG
jgi:peptidoglycan L-alanyl-D-glutamate endopeptidase CwlK